MLNLRVHCRVLRRRTVILWVQITLLWGKALILSLLMCFPCVKSLTTFPDVFWIFFVQTMLPAMKGYRQQTTKFLYRLVGSEDLLTDHSIVSPYTSRVLKPYIRYGWAEVELALGLGSSSPHFLGSDRSIFVGGDAFLLGSDPCSREENLEETTGQRSHHSH